MTTHTVHYYNPGQHWPRMGITFPSPSSLPTYNADIAGGVGYGRGGRGGGGGVRVET